MSTIPTISVCIPTYNGAAYIEEAINSVLKQTFQDFEIIIADDLSNDNTLQIAADFSSKDKRIKLFKNPANLGLVGNWNNCIEQAKGIWIKFLFQDDYLEKDCLEKMIAASENSNLVIANRKYVFEDGFTFKEQAEYIQFEKELSFSNLYKNPLIDAQQFSYYTALYPAINIWGEPSSTLIKKSLFDVYGKFDSGFSQTCDLEFITRIGTNENIALVHENLIYFRVHKQSTSMQNHSEKAFLVHYKDFFQYVHHLYFGDFYKNFRSNTKNKNSIIKYKLAKQILNLRKWKGAKSQEENYLKNTFPELKAYLLAPYFYLLKSVLSSMIEFPEAFIKKITG